MGQLIPACQSIHLCNPANTFGMFFLALILLVMSTQAQASVSTCQEAILRCCSVGQKATSETWRCFEQNNCGGLFTAHEEGTGRGDLGACAFVPSVLNNLDYDYDDEDPVGVRTVARPKFDEEEEEEEETIENQVEELAVKETELGAKRPYFFQNGFLYRRTLPPFYHHYGHFQRCQSAVSYPHPYHYPYTYSYYLG